MANALFKYLTLNHVFRMLLGAFLMRCVYIMVYLNLMNKNFSAPMQQTPIVHVCCQNHTFAFYW